MNHFKALRITLVVVGATLLLNGCTTPGKNTIPPAGDMTMAQIYYQESGLSAPDATSSNVTIDGLTAARSTAPIGQADYQGQGASDLMALNSQFKTLPNPQIIVYVSPHLVTNGGNVEAPVPGYVTSFFMYPQTEFAMPYEHY